MPRGWPRTFHRHYSKSLVATWYEHTYSTISTLNCYPIPVNKHPASLVWAVTPGYIHILDARNRHAAFFFFGGGGTVCRNSYIKTYVTAPLLLGGVVCEFIAEVSHCADVFFEVGLVTAFFMHCKKKKKGALDQSPFPHTCQYNLKLFNKQILNR